MSELPCVAGQTSVAWAVSRIAPGRHVVKRNLVFWNSAKVGPAAMAPRRFSDAGHAPSTQEIWPPTRTQGLVAPGPARSALRRRRPEAPQLRLVEGYGFHAPDAQRGEAGGGTSLGSAEGGQLWESHLELGWAAWGQHPG